MNGPVCDEIAAELGRWPGASVAFEHGGKHPRAVLTFAGQSKFVVYAATPSDTGRGTQNKIAEVRRVLRDLGASQKPAAKTNRPAAQRNMGAKTRQMQRDLAPVIANPLDALAAWTPPAEPMADAPAQAADNRQAEQFSAGSVSQRLRVWIASFFNKLIGDAR